ASFTEKDFVKKQSNQPKPDTKSVQYAANLGGPIIQDKLHFFANVERVENDRPNSVVGIDEPVTQDRVWNTLIRLDHPSNAGNSWFSGWLREWSPQLNQIINNGQNLPVTPLSSREESDIDQTAVAQYDAVIGPTKLNTARVTWTQENVAFANPG